jgi:hypothetical protein
MGGSAISIQAHLSFFVTNAELSRLKIVNNP